jgi:uncharacterized protein
MSESNIQASPGSIFICYRREDSADVTGRIYDRLVDHLGPERVFMDVEAIRLGYDFRSEIDQTIKVCSIVIVVIGDQWLSQVDGRRRIDDENDRVRIEIEAALRREIPIIPVLTRGASHPTKAMLPASLEALAYRHGTSIRHEHFRGDVDSLISQMEKLLARQESTPSKPAESKEPTLPPKSTQTTQSEPAIPPVASISAKAALKEPAVWRRKRLITVTAVGATVILLLAITVLLTRPHPSLNRPHPSVEPSAENDYAEAVKLASGLGGTRIDLPKAAEYLQRAAAKNEPEAEAHLAYWVINGVGGLAKDNVKAEQWAKKALADGLTVKATNSVEAQIALAGLYRFGLGVSNDLGKAAELYQKAADQGNAMAQFNLGWLYQNGLGVTKDLGKAAELYQKAADQGNAQAQTELAWFYEGGRGVPKDMGKAAELYQKAADRGFAPAQTNLGMVYRNGEGVPKDLGKAAELYQKAADQGYARAQLGLGGFYESGQGVPKDLGKAAELYQKAADQGLAPAQTNLGMLYQNGQGVPKDLGKAAELYQKAADQGFPPAIANLKRLSKPPQPNQGDAATPDLTSASKQSGSLPESTPPAEDTGQAVIIISLASDQHGQHIATSFDANTAAIYGLLTTVGLKRGDVLASKWIAEDVRSVSKENTLNEGKMSIFHDIKDDDYFAYRPPSWNPGKYRLEVYRNGKLGAKAEFTIRERK